MAEQYQLPGQFTVPSMAEISYQAGDSQAVDNANFKMFTDQINAYTNINNANRLQSLREREFVNKLKQDDRNFELRREELDSTLRNNDITFEINKFNFDRNKETYNQLQEAWSQREEWNEGIDNLMPNGGNSPTYLRDKARAFRLFAKNPSSYAVLNELFKPYDDQYKVYQANKSLEDEAEVQSAFEEGLLDGEKVGDQDASAYFRDIILNREADPVAYAAGMRNLKRLATIGREDVARQRQALLDAETKGRFEAEAYGAGATDVELTMEGGKIVRKAKTPRVYGASRAGTSASGPNVSQISQASKDYIDSATKIGEQITELQGSIDGMPEGIEKTAAEANLAGLQRQQQFYYKKAEEVSSQGGATAPSGTPAGTGARGVLAPSIKDVKKPASQETPASAPATRQTPGVSSLESTLSPGARVALGVGKSAVGVGGRAVEQALGTVPGVKAAISASKTIKPVLEFAESAGSVARELAQYSKNVNRAEKAARERAKKGENFQAALLDEQQKIIEELSQAADSKSSVTSKF